MIALRQLPSSADDVLRRSKHGAGVKMQGKRDGGAEGGGGGEGWKGRGLLFLGLALTGKSCLVKAARKEGRLCAPLRCPRC